MSIEYIPLSEGVEKIIDYRGKTPKKMGGDWSEEGIRTVSAKNVHNGVLDNIDSIRCVSQEIYEKWMKDKIQRNDIFIASEGASMGESLIWESDEQIVLGQRLFAVRANKEVFNPFYLAMYMRTTEYRKELENHCTGTSVLGLSQPSLLKTKIRYIPLKLQNYIGEMYQNICNKIFVNTQINRNLSEQAKAIFDENFGTYSDTNGVIGDLGIVITGKTPPTKNDEYYGNDIPFIKTPDMHGSMFLTDVNEYLSLKGADSQRGKYIPAYTVLMSCIGAGAGEMGITSERSQFNQQINAVVSEYPCLTWFILQSKINYLRSIGSAGSTMININKSTFENCPIFIPSCDEKDSFEKMVRPLFDDILSNQKQNAKLSLLRDNLLPKLMSGELDVSDLDI